LNRILLDTNAIAALLHDRLSARAKEAVLAADYLAASAISFYEIHQKVRLAKWPEMELWIGRLHDALISSGIEVIAVEDRLAAKAASFDWSNRDPFDRIIVATAERDRLIVATADRLIAERVQTIW
jgi:PIN domain nuclease of toxin-antitoxin system